jgi:hypothetical protein
MNADKIKAEAVISTDTHPRLSAVDLAPAFERHPHSSEESRARLHGRWPLINADPEQEQDKGLLQHVCVYRRSSAVAWDLDVFTTCSGFQ